MELVPSAAASSTATHLTGNAAAAPVVDQPMTGTIGRSCSNAHELKVSGEFRPTLLVRTPADLKHLNPAAGRRPGTYAECLPQNRM
jgi:hypothetical protein